MALLAAAVARATDPFSCGITAKRTKSVHFWKERAYLFAGACACAARQTDAKKHKMNVWLPPLSEREARIWW